MAAQIPHNRLPPAMRVPPAMRTQSGLSDADKAKLFDDFERWQIKRRQPSSRADEGVVNQSSTKIDQAPLKGPPR